MIITYEFVTNGENKQIVFKGEDSNSLFNPISCTTDIHFARLVDYLIGQINVGQVITCTCANDAIYPFDNKEKLIKETIDKIIAKYNETVQRNDLESEVVSDGLHEEDPDVQIDEPQF